MNKPRIGLDPYWLLVVVEFLDAYKSQCRWAGFGRLLGEFEMLCVGQWLPAPLMLRYFVGFHSRANRCASAIWAGVIKDANAPRAFFASSSPCVAAKLNHMWPRT